MLLRGREQARLQWDIIYISDHRTIRHRGQVYVDLGVAFQAKRGRIDQKTRISEKEWHLVPSRGMYARTEALAQRYGLLERPVHDLNGPYAAIEETKHDSSGCSSRTKPNSALASLVPSW